MSAIVLLYRQAAQLARFGGVLAETQLVNYRVRQAHLGL